MLVKPTTATWTVTVGDTKLLRYASSAIHYQRDGARARRRVAID